MADDVSAEDEQKGKQLLTAVERLVASNASIREVVALAETKAKARAPEATKSRPTLREAAAQELVRTYSNRAAIAGGASGLPALIPGVGSLAAGIAGTFAELAYLLKTEVELCLAMSHLYGFDIDDARERQLAFLTASVATYDAGGGSVVSDILKAEGVAIWNYGPRALARLVIRVFTALALGYVWRGFLKMIPVLGIVVGSSMNKVLTQRVGQRAMSDFRTRRELLEREAPARPTSKAPRTVRKVKKRRKPAP